MPTKKPLGNSSQINILAQPSRTVNLGEWLSANLDDPQWSRLEIAVAFTSAKGVMYLRERISAFSARASLVVVVGIDRFGTSYEALDAILSALGKTGEAWVFHDEGPHLFHPKLYAFSNDNKAIVAIGSHNLTEGGLYTNYELALEINLDQRDQHQRRLFLDLQALVRSFCDPSTGSARRLTKGELSALYNEKYVLKELEIAAARPPSPVRRKRRFKSQTVPLPPRGIQRSEASKKPKTPTTSSPPVTRGFVMTLQNTDVGRGQVSPHTSQRSPEIFLPVLAVRDQEPEFWGWPADFTPDPLEPERKTRPIVVRLAGERVDAKIWRNPPPPVGKNDFRLRSESLRSAGSIGDLLKIELASRESGYDYYVEIIPRGRSDHARYLALCTETAQRPNSKKRWGYYA